MQEKLWISFGRIQNLELTREVEYKKPFQFDSPRIWFTATNIVPLSDIPCRLSQIEICFTPLRRDFLDFYQALVGTVAQQVQKLTTGWTVRGSNPGGDEFSAPVQTHPASCKIGTGSFSGVKSGRGLTLTPHTLPVPQSRKSRAIPLLPLWVYGLCRASVPVQGCTLPFFNTLFSIERYQPWVTGIVPALDARKSSDNYLTNQPTLLCCTNRQPHTKLLSNSTLTHDTLLTHTTRSTYTRYNNSVMPSSEKLPAADDVCA